MNEDDRILIADLSESFGRQLGWYRELRSVVQKLLGQLVLSRGDLSCLMEGFTRKQKLLEQIAAERLRTSEQVASWQARKSLFAADPDVRALDAILGQTESAIRDFLDNEEQLKRYLESMMQKPAATPGT